MSTYGKKSTKKPSYFKPQKSAAMAKKKNITFQPKKLTVEKKSIDSGIAAAVLPAGTWTGLNNANLIRQGTISNQRVGREVQMKSFQLRYEPGSGTQPQRMLVVYDKQPTGTAPVITDILTADSFTAFTNLDNKERFVTLIDVLVTPGGSVGVGEEYRKMDLPVVFKADTGVNSDFSTGAIYYMFCASLAAPATYTARSRIRYTDC